MLPVHTCVGQGWTTNSSWGYMIVIPGNLKQQTETETGSYWDEVILTALWGDKANVAPRATLSKLGFWTFNFGGHSDIFPIHSSLFPFKLSLFSFKFTVSIVGDKRQKHRQTRYLKKQLYSILPCWNISRVVPLYLHFHYLSSLMRLQKMTFDNGFYMIIPSLQLLLQSRGRITFSLKKTKFSYFPETN